MKKINQFIQWLKTGKQISQKPITAPQPGETMRKLLVMVENTDDVEIGCDEVFDVLDQYVELEAHGEDVTKLLPLVRKHLDRCLDCREEYEALVKVLNAASF